RVIPGFMIQGGGMLPGLEPKETQAPIRNEATNGLENLRGTLAMARTNDINSATSQFFINLTDNDFLNHAMEERTVEERFVDIAQKVGDRLGRFPFEQFDVEAAGGGFETQHQSYSGCDERVIGAAACVSRSWPARSGCETT
ncbi:hypothetical protein EBU60_06815, partial [bacterium]|nr:hypothetical protein [bacterium]